MPHKVKINLKKKKQNSINTTNNSISQSYSQDTGGLVSHVTLLTAMYETTKDNC